ncbi:MAG: hypothetical protein A07HR60_02034 [uncultured archaeon A07HR60]|nr:MAG: hypothetical protein A07HR60_02034 [uncultured archaeon A07HR60]
MLTRDKRRSLSQDSLSQERHANHTVARPTGEHLIGYYLESGAKRAAGQPAFGQCR